MDFEKIQYSKKYDLLKQIGKMYRNCEINIEINEGFLIKEKPNLYKCVQVKGRVDVALRQLSNIEAFIIRKEFLENTSKHWYLDYFKEYDYDALQQKVANKFLHALYG